MIRVLGFALALVAGVATYVVIWPALIHPAEVHWYDIAVTALVTVVVMVSCAVRSERAARRAGR